MVHCLLIKMISQIISYFVNHKDHLNHNGGSKLTCLDWHESFFMPIILSIYGLKHPIK
jgi:hypothetical protein